MISDEQTLAVLHFSLALVYGTLYGRYVLGRSLAGIWIYLLYLTRQCVRYGRAFATSTASSFHYSCLILGLEARAKSTFSTGCELGAHRLPCSWVDMAFGQYPA